MTNFTNLIIGAGFAGATLARRLAEQGQTVRLIDRRNHLAGNSFDYWQNGICVHHYGTHIFHTQIPEVWQFLSRFTTWHDYAHEVRGKIDGREIPIPFNLNSLYVAFDHEFAQKLEQKLLANFGREVKVPILQLRQTDDADLQELAEYVYQKVFLHYTTKQWGVKPEELSEAVLARVPVFISRDNRYFQDTYQGIPAEGATKLVERMLDHPNIRIELNTDYQADPAIAPNVRVFYSGSIDEYYQYTLGVLPYRSLRFEFQTLSQAYFQSGAVINYPGQEPYTRIGEYKYFLDSQTPDTVISYEYPQSFVLGQNERFYPIENPANRDLYQRYCQLNQTPDRLFFFGRLGDYKYYNIDQAIYRASQLAEQLADQ